MISNNTATGGTCFGDSGGPTFDNTSSNVVVAVTSFGIRPQLRRHRRGLPPRPARRPVVPRGVRHPPVAARLSRSRRPPASAGGRFRVLDKRPWRRCVRWRHSTARGSPDARPPRPPPPDRRPRRRLPRLRSRRVRSARPRPTTSCSRRSAGRCRRAARRPARSSTTSAGSPIPGLDRERRAALLRVRDRRQPAVAPLAADWLTTAWDKNGVAYAIVARRRPSSRRSRRAGCIDAVRPARATSRSGSRPGRRWRRSRASRRAATGSSQRAGWNVEERRPDRRARDRGRRSAPRPTSTSTCRSRCSGSGAAASIGSRPTSRAGCGRIGCARCSPGCATGR